MQSRILKYVTNSTKVFHVSRAKKKKKNIIRSPLWETKKRINRIGGGKRDKQVGGVPIYKKYLHSEFERTQHFYIYTLCTYI